MSGQNPRQIAARVLQCRRNGHEFIENLLENALGVRFSSADRGLCQELTYGVVRWQATLDWLIARKTQGRTQKAALQDLLRLGLYQIFWLDRIPEHAAVHETVEMAKQAGFGPQAGFVNAVLRGYLRELEITRGLLAELKATQPALGYSHPEWLVERWRQRWDDERTRQLLEWNNSPPATCARVNTLKTDAGKLVEQWRTENVDYDFIRRDWCEENLAFALKSHPPLTRLPSFQQGGFYIQDPGTLLAVQELDPQPGELILDACAAPGGKTTYLAQRLRNEGHIVAADVSAERLNLVHENCARLGVTCVETVLLENEIGPAAHPAGEAAPTPTARPAKHLHFDKILLDAPCSNTGVMRRRVDLRWRIRPEEIERLRATQRKLLDQTAALLKPGGVLVYSTCSLEPEENGGVVTQFLQEQGAFKLERQRELLPFTDGVDGAFVARLRRT
ncbi:MAG: 16S rRNA (cytosine(967)-C(5))-methyltransferase RsmB [Verrucomicrobia bacterium]|nr:16S rRNA (cytosine(967)-C(5))-methyltransferase RsmB [Verrucomicrobiota bacterium]